MKDFELSIPLMCYCSHLLPKDAKIVYLHNVSLVANKKAMVQMVQFLEEGDGDRISGEAMLKRAKRLGGRLGLWGPRILF